MKRFIGALFALCLSAPAFSETFVVDPGQSINGVCGSAAPGDICLIHGTHRVQVNPRNGVTYEGGTGAVIKGSDVVTGWTAHATLSGVFTKAWTTNSQQVFVNGAGLQQIGGTISSAYPSHVWTATPGNQTNMPFDSFYLASNVLYIKPTGGIAGKTIEVSVLPYIVHGYDVHGYSLKGLTFEHSNTTASGSSGALRLIGDNVTLDAITLRDCDGTGVTLRGDNAVVKDSLFTRCGQFGVTGSGLNHLWENNEVSHNNTRNFYVPWGAGASKFMGSSPLGGVSGIDNSAIRGNKFIYNNGNGLWLDFGNSNNLIEGNTAAYNSGSSGWGEGIFVEISSDNVVRGNFVYGNQQRGIYVNGARNLVENNLVLGNSNRNIASFLDTRQAGGPADNEYRGNIIAFAAGGTVRSLSLPALTYPAISDRNLFIESVNPIMGFQGGSSYTSLLNWQTGSGKDMNGWQRITPMPSSIAAALAAQQLITDWSQFQTWARDVDAANPPGPFVAAPPPPVDVCPNIEGVQETIPVGMVHDASGDCVTPPPPPVETDAEKIVRLEAELAAVEAELKQAKAQRVVDLAEIKKLTEQRDLLGEEMLRYEAGIGNAKDVLECLLDVAAC